MKTEQEMEAYIKKRLNKNRYEHSLSVRDTAVKLAMHYGVDAFKAGIAGLIHDCAKDLKDDELLKTAREQGYEVDEVSEASPQLLHGLVAAAIGENDFGVKDTDILNAVRYHTTGREKMSSLEKIVYLADYIEPLRQFNGVEELRKRAFESLDEALLLSFDNTIVFVVSRGELLHKDTILARNYLIKERL